MDLLSLRNNCCFRGVWWLYCEILLLKLINNVQWMQLLILIILFASYHLGENYFLCSRCLYWCEHIYEWISRAQLPCASLASTQVPVLVFIRCLRGSIKSQISSLKCGAQADHSSLQETRLKREKFWEMWRERSNIPIMGTACEAQRWKQGQVHYHPSVRRHRLLPESFPPEESHHAHPLTGARRCRLTAAVGGSVHQEYQLMTWLKLADHTEGRRCVNTASVHVWVSVCVCAFLPDCFFFSINGAWMDYADSVNNWGTVTQELHVCVCLCVCVSLLSTHKQVNKESLSTETGPFVLCAKGEHGGELVLILLWLYLNYAPEERRAEREVLAQRERQEHCLRESQRKRKEQGEGRRVQTTEDTRKLPKKIMRVWGNRKLNQAQVDVLWPSDICQVGADREIWSLLLIRRLESSRLSVWLVRPSCGCVTNMFFSPVTTALTPRRQCCKSISAAMEEQISGKGFLIFGETRLVAAGFSIKSASRSSQVWSNQL